MNKVLLVFAAFLAMLIGLTALAVPALSATAEAQQYNEQAALIAPKALSMDYAAFCDKGVAVYKIRNESKPWMARALITFMGERDVILAQRAQRMTSNQTVSYRVKKPDLVGAVAVLIDYPGYDRISCNMGKPCS